MVVFVVKLISKSSQIKTGAEPKLSSLERISNALNVSLDWLVRGEGDVHRGAKNDALTPRKKALLGLYDALSDSEQQEILLHAEDKKRMHELEEIVSQLQRKVG